MDAWYREGGQQHGDTPQQKHRAQYGEQAPHQDEPTNIQQTTQNKQAFLT